MGNVAGPELPPYYEGIRDNTDEIVWNVLQTREDYKMNKSIPMSWNTFILRTLHIIFIVGIMCDIIISSIYTSPFLLFSTKISENNRLIFMGNISFIFMYILSFMSFIGLTMCLCHFCCMVCWDPCTDYGPKILCKCCDLLESIVCIGCVPLFDALYICLGCTIFFIAFCISPALVLYIALFCFCRNNSMTDITYHDYSTEHLMEAVKLQKRMDLLNPNDNKIKTLLMKAVIHALYARIDINKHKQNVHSIIMHHCHSISLQQLHIDSIFHFYDKKINLSHLCHFIDWKELCLYSGCSIWIILYLIIVTVFLLCFGYSENNNNTFLWRYYIISYSIFLILFLFILLLNYLDAVCRMRENFAWTHDLKWSQIQYSKFTAKIDIIWDGIERYKCLQSLLYQKWMIQLIMEYAQFGNMATWPSFD